MKLERLNAGLDHFSGIETGEEPTSLEEVLPDAQIFSIKVVDDNFADVIHFLNMGIALTD